MKKSLLKICDELFRDCADLFIRFDDLEVKAREDPIQMPFSQCCYTVAGGDGFIKKFGKNKDPGSRENESIFDALWNFSQNVTSLAFAFGFAAGQMIDPTSPEDLDRVKKIQQVIREKRLLPYVPREITKPHQKGSERG